MSQSFHVSCNCCFLTHIQVSQETRKVILYSHLFKTLPWLVVIHIVKGFSIINEAEVFLKLPWLLHDPRNTGSFISGSLASLKPSLYIWKFCVHLLPKPSLKDFEHNLAGIWNECNCMVVWTFFGIVLLWDWNENWSFPDLWPLLSFPNLLAYWAAL